MKFSSLPRNRWIQSGFYRGYEFGVGLMSSNYMCPDGYIPLFAVVNVNSDVIGRLNLSKAPVWGGISLRMFDAIGFNSARDGGRSALKPDGEERSLMEVVMKCEELIDWIEDGKATDRT